MALSALELRDILNEDMDEAFSYQTAMNANIKDRYLGLLALCIKLSVLFYVVIYVFIVAKAHIMYEYEQGKVLFFSSGTAFSRPTNNTVHIWDSVDLIWPKNPSSFFVPTRIEETIAQQRGNCTDFSRPCSRNSDCQGACEGGYCVEPSWCSALPPIIHLLEGIPNIMFYVQADIEFIKLAKNHDFSTMDEKGFHYDTDDGPNVFLVADVLDEADILYEEIVETGCVVKVKMKWKCHITSEYNCDDPDLKAHRLDDENDNDPNGYRLSRYQYYQLNGTIVRDHWNMTGIYIIGTTEGLAHQTSLTSIISNVSAAMNLLMLAEILTDFIMLTCMKHRKEYRRVVMEQTHNLDAMLQGLKKEEKKEEVKEEDPDDFFSADL